MKVRKEPERMCLGCSKVFPKKQLIRIVRDSEGKISLDKTGKKAGRGAYICNNVQCLQLLAKNKRLAKQFGCAIEQEIYDQLMEVLNDK